MFAITHRSTNFVSLIIVLVLLLLFPPALQAQSDSSPDTSKPVDKPIAKAETASPDQNKASPGTEPSVSVKAENTEQEETPSDKKEITKTENVAGEAIAQPTTSKAQRQQAATPEPANPIDWMLTIRKTSLYEGPAYGKKKLPLLANTPLILLEKDKFGWFRVETADKQTGWLPGFHAKAGEGTPPAELVPPPPEPEPPASPAEPEPTIPSLSAEQIATRIKVVQIETAAMRDFVSLKPSSTLKVSALFLFDLTNQEVVAKRITELSARIAEKQRIVRYLQQHQEIAEAAEAAKPTPPVGDESETDKEKLQPTPTEEKPQQPSRLAFEKAELNLLELRQAFLSRKLEDRKALLAAEEEAERLAQLKAKEEADRKRAEEEARAAEEARQQALERAEAATNSAERALALESAKLEGFKGKLAEYRKRLSIERQDMIALTEKRSKTLTDTSALAEAARKNSPEADSLYDSVVDQLTLARNQIQQHLDQTGSLPKAPRYSGDPSDLQALTPEQVQERADLTAGTVRLAAEADAADKEMREIVWERARSTVDYELALNSLRLSLLERVTSTKRRSILGLGREGIAQFGRELAHFSLTIHWMEFAGERLAYEKLEQLKDPYQFISIITPLIGFFFLVIIYFGLGRALGKLFAKPYKRTVGMGRRRLRDRLAGTAYNIAKPLHREILFVIFVLLLPIFADVTAEQSAIALVYRLLLIYGLYRLIRTAAFYLLFDLIQTNVGELDDRRRSKLLRSVVIASRFAFWMLALLVIAGYVLGKGYLYHLVVWATKIGTLIIAVGMIYWWRNKIREDVIALRPNAMISQELQRSQGRWYSILIVFAAFGYLIWIGMVGGVRRLMLGFDISQKLLAYLFRKKLEQQKVQSRKAESIELPAEILENFEEHPAVDDQLLMDHFPKMDAFLSQFESWKEGNRTGSFLVLGKSGHGKTTWLQEAMRRIEDFPATYIPLGKRLVTPEKILSSFSRSMLPGEDPPETIEALAERIRESDRKLVVLDNMQYLFLRGVDTIRGWWAFNRLMEATADHIFWLGAFTQHTYQFLSWVRNDKDAFRDSVTLAPWDEKQISEMLAARMKASGWSARYVKLLPARQSTIYTSAQIAEITADFNRLIWDFTHGSPRVAIHYWKKSLVPSNGNIMDVRLFPQPDMKPLEDRDEMDKFTLAAVFWHQKINADEAAESLRYPIYACRDSLEKMRELGILECLGGNYGVTVEWWPLVYRYLRRKNLIRN